MNFLTFGNLSVLFSRHLNSASVVLSCKWSVSRLIVVVSVVNVQCTLHHRGDYGLA